MGDNPDLEPGFGVRIFTGARVPDQADTVIMQEKVTSKENFIEIPVDTPVHVNIRSIGEQVKKGNLALPKGTVLTPAGIGLLATLGISEVTIFKAPKVGILVTGDELVLPGQILDEGKIYESNSSQLQSALAVEHINHTTIYRAKDTFKNTRETIQEAFDQNDIVLISGGISVGDYDFVKAVLEAIETKELFYKVKQKPGKPLYFGMHKEKPVFALPGNPASSLTCFYLYVVPLLRMYMGKPNTNLIRTSKTLAEAYHKTGDRAEFLKAEIKADSIKILGGQSSAMVHTYALANALIYFSADSKGAEAGEKVEVLLLPS